MEIRTRRLPKKTVVLIFLISFLAIFTFLVQKNLKEAKFSEILATLGHKDIKNLRVINKLDVEDVQTKTKSNVFKIKFYDNSLNKTCVGFLHQEKDGSFKEDLDCK